MGNDLFRLGITSASATEDALGSGTNSLYFNGLESAISFVGFGGSDPGANNTDIDFGLANGSGLIPGNGSVGSGNLEIFVAGNPTLTGDDNYFLISTSLIRNQDDSITYGINVDVFDGFNNTLSSGDFTNEFSATGTLSPSEHGLDLTQTFRPAIGFEVADGGQIGNTGASYDWDDSLQQFANPVPEPSASLLVGLCGLGLTMKRRRSS